MTLSAKPIDPKDYRALYPFASHFLMRDGWRYHYVNQGVGDPMVMVHGNPTWSFYFRRLITAFSSRYRVIVPDHMGCGLSDKPAAHQYNFRLASRVRDFTALMDHLALQRVTLVVHDWGGMIALAWATANPHRVSRLVITNTAAFMPPANKRIPLRLRLIRDVGALATPAVLYANLFARGAIHLAPHRRLAADVKRGLLAPYNCPRHRLATLRFVQDIPLRAGDPGYAIVKRTEQHLKDLAHLPILILWGRHDFVFDLDYFDEWRRRFPNAEHHLFDEAGHYLLEDVPEQVVARIDAFLDQHSG